MTLIQEGKYKARAIEGAFTKLGKNGSPALVIIFEFEVSGARTTLRRDFYLSEKVDQGGKTAAERAYDTLFNTLGFDENKPLLRADSGEEYFDRSFFADKEVEIVVEHEKDQRDVDANKNLSPGDKPIEVRKYAKIRWINEMGGGQYKGLSVQEVTGGQSLKALAAKARQGKSAPTGSPKPEADIPF